MTVPTDLFDDVARWLVLDRGALTIFAHADTGEDLANHTPTRHLVRSDEGLDLSNLG